MQTGISILLSLPAAAVQEASEADLAAEVSAVAEDLEAASEAEVSAEAVPEEAGELVFSRVDGKISSFGNPHFTFCKPRILDLNPLLFPKEISITSVKSAGK